MNFCTETRVRKYTLLKAYVKTLNIVMIGRSFKYYIRNYRSTTGDSGKAGEKAVEFEVDHSRHLFCDHFRAN